MHFLSNVIKNLFRRLLFLQDLRISGRAQQITQTVRVLRARSALLLPSPQLNLPPSPLQVYHYQPSPTTPGLPNY